MKTARPLASSCSWRRISFVESCFEKFFCIDVYNTYTLITYWRNKNLTDRLIFQAHSKMGRTLHKALWECCASHRFDTVDTAEYDQVRTCDIFFAAYVEINSLSCCIRALRHVQSMRVRLFLKEAFDKEAKDAIATTESSLFIISIIESQLWAWFLYGLWTDF